MLYVFGWGTLGMDGKWIGALGGDRGYFPLQIDPGEHHLCARFSTRTGPAALIKVKELAFRSLAAKPGETYRRLISTSQVRICSSRLNCSTRTKVVTLLAASSTFSASARSNSDVIGRERVDVLRISCRKSDWPAALAQSHLETTVRDCEFCSKSEATHAVIARELVGEWV